jgi:hypothetical protein
MSEIKVKKLNLSNQLQKAESIALADILALNAAEANYGDSWKKRGGIGAFMMLARKWDRIENQVSPRRRNKNYPTYDIFQALTTDDRDEGILDDVRDLRRYLLLVESEVYVGE